jgi:hypothetical protein
MTCAKAVVAVSRVAVVDRTPEVGSNQGKNPMIPNVIAKVAVAARANPVAVSRAAVVSPIAS